MQRGKYPGFQTDSEVLFVTVLSPARHGAESEPKKPVARPSYRLGADPESEGVKRENRRLEWLRPPVLRYGICRKTHAAVERISNRSAIDSRWYESEADVTRRIQGVCWTAWQ